MEGEYNRVEGGQTGWRVDTMSWRMDMTGWMEDRRVGDWIDGVASG